MLNLLEALVDTVVELLPAPGVLFDRPKRPVNLIPGDVVVAVDTVDPVPKHARVAGSQLCLFLNHHAVGIDQGKCRVR